MRKLLSSPLKMSLSESENAIYQNALSQTTDLILNLMAIKVTERPEDFTNWCRELLSLTRHQLNMDLLEDEQLKPLKKLQDILELGVSTSQLRMTRIAPWPIYVSFIEEQQSLHALEERLGLLNYAAELRETPLAEMLEEDRLAITGKHTSQHDHSVYSFDVEWFASTRGAKVFHHLLSTQPEAFDEALSHIPLAGDVTPDQYRNFANAFSAIFANHKQDKATGEKAPVSVASRLLAMRRPDQFIALTAAKIDVLCQGLSLPKFNNFDLMSYWHDLIGTLRTCAWWHQSEPEDSRELLIWQNRAILIDVFLFADESLASQSNFIKLRDKALNKQSSKSSKPVAKKRTKESAEMLVDKALSADDLPEFIQTKRDSIVNLVKNGKSVEHAIGMMRAIFG